MEEPKGQVEAGLATLFAAGSALGRSDGELLDLFMAAGGSVAESAFAAMIDRHGPMVWRICRDVLHESNDADDAFQATFLILARRAAAIRQRSSVGPWLYGVAFRVARSSRSRAARRQSRERIIVAPEFETKDSMSDVDRLDGLPILHEEVGRLPEKYRSPLVLCYFQGLTHEQAASRLGWPVGTVRSRLAKARDRLRPRLLWRGVTPAVALFAALDYARGAPVPAALAAATVKMAGKAGAAGIVPTSVAVLIRMTLRETNMLKLSVIATGLVVATLASVGFAGYVAGAPRPQEPEKTVTSKKNAPIPKAEPDLAEIRVGEVKSGPVEVFQRYVCQIHASRHIQVRALVEGTLSEIPVQEGAAVKAGDLLFKISPTLYQKRLDAEKADRAVAQLELNQAKNRFEKKELTQDDVKIAEAKLAKADAEVDLAQAELNFTMIKAPFDGIVGRAQHQVGSLVLTGEPLTNLSDNSALWVYFSMPERGYLEYMAENAQKKQDLNISLELADGSKFSQAGKLGAIEAKFENETGLIPFRIDFPNPEKILRHGQTGNIIFERNLENALTIPQRATFETTIGKRGIYVVDKDGIAHPREVVIQYEKDDAFVIKSGVAAGDKIVVDGVLRIYDGQKVE